MNIWRLMAGAACLYATPAFANVDNKPAIGQAFLEALNSGCVENLKSNRDLLSARFASNDPVPDYVSEGANRTGLGKPSYWHISATEGDVWIILFGNDPICSVQAYGSNLAQVESSIAGTIQSNGQWRADPKLDVIRGERRVRVFDTELDKKRIQMVLISTD